MRLIDPLQLGDENVEARSAYEGAPPVPIVDECDDFFRWPLLRSVDEPLARFRARNREEELLVGMLRVGVPDYAPAAFREGLANALIHRDTMRLGAVHVQWHDGRIEVANPGGFPEGVRLDNLLVTQPRPRNPLLADALERAGIVERTARGVDTIFYEQLRNGRPAPSYARSNETGVVLVLPGGKANLGLARLVETGLVETRGERKGRSWHLSAATCRRLDDKAGNVRQRGFEPPQQDQMVLQLVAQHGRMLEDIPRHGPRLAEELREAGAAIKRHTANERPPSARHARRRAPAPVAGPHNRRSLDRWQGRSGACLQHRGRPRDESMTKTARVSKIEMLIRSRGCTSFKVLREEVEVSPATLKRDLDYLKDQLGAPILYDRFLNGYRFGVELRGRSHELPGPWFSEREVYSLLKTHQLLSELGGEGTLSRHLQLLLERVHEMLGFADAEARAIVKRVKIISPARRPVLSRFFELVGEALVKRRRLAMRYPTRGRGEVTERQGSPQRLVHYRNTWYTDAWCHCSEGLRRFALDAIEGATLLETREGRAVQAGGGSDGWRLRDLRRHRDSMGDARVQASSGAVGQPGGVAPGATR